MTTAAAGAARIILGLMDPDVRQYLDDFRGQAPASDLLQDCDWPEDLAERLGPLLDKHITTGPEARKEDR